MSVVVVACPGELASHSLTRPAVDHLLGSPPAGSCVSVTHCFHELPAPGDCRNHNAFWSLLLLWPEQLHELSGQGTGISGFRRPKLPAWCPQPPGTACSPPELPAPRTESRSYLSKLELCTGRGATGPSSRPSSRPRHAGACWELLTWDQSLPAVPSGPGAVTLMCAGVLTADSSSLLRQEQQWHRGWDASAWVLWPTQSQRGRLRGPGQACSPSSSLLQSLWGH